MCEITCIHANSIQYLIFFVCPFVPVESIQSKSLAALARKNAQTFTASRSSAIFSNSMLMCFSSDSTRSASSMSIQQLGPYAELVHNATECQIMPFPGRCGRSMPWAHSLAKNDGLVKRRSFRTRMPKSLESQRKSPRTWKSQRKPQRLQSLQSWLYLDLVIQGAAWNEKDIAWALEWQRR